MIEHERRHSEVDRNFFAAHDVQATVEAAYTTVDMGQLADPTFQAIQKDAQKAAMLSAYLRDLTALQDVIDRGTRYDFPDAR